MSPDEARDSQEGSAGGGGRFACLLGEGGHREGVGGVPRGGKWGDQKERAGMAR